MQWYYAVDDQKLGPVSHTELERLVRTKKIEEGTLLWKQGMNDWQTLAQIRAVHPHLIVDVAPPPMPFESSETPVEAASGRSHEVPASGSGSNNGSSAYAGPAPVPASFFQRAGAHVIDVILWFFVWNVVSQLISMRLFPEAMKLAETMNAALAKGQVYQATPEEAVVVMKLVLVLLLVGFVTAVLYDALFLLKFAATPGKLIFGLRVVRADGSLPGFSRIIARCLAKGLSGVPTLGIGYLIAAFDDEKRALHDFFCKTRVVKK